MGEREGRTEAAGLPAGRPEGRVYGILVTFRRPHQFREVVRSILRQQRRPDAMWVIDNAPVPENRVVAEELAGAGIPLHFMASAQNLGPAGAKAWAMEEILAQGTDDDWLMMFDDDMPLESPLAIETMLQFASRMRELDPELGGVGRIGHRFSWRRGRLIRPPDEDLVGVLPVDYLTTGHAQGGSLPIPVFSLRAVRDVGVFQRELFIGLTEVEYGLRMKRRGHRLYVNSRIWNPGRGEDRPRRGPRALIDNVSWRRYYSLRNLLVLLLQNRHPVVAVRIAVIRGLLKPLLNMPFRPVLSARLLGLNTLAVVHAFTGRLGRRVEPPEG